MNKITSKPQLNIEYRTLNKAQTDSFRHKMIMKTSQLLNSEISINKYGSNILSENSEEKNIFIKKGALERTISVYQWRYKTCYPVVKPTRLVVKTFTGGLQQKKTLGKKNSQSPFQIWNLDENIFELIVSTQRINYRLNQLGVLSLPQLFYLLKQILVGFQCLIDIFGLFQPTEEMVIVNQQNQWRFWISEDFASNSKKESNITEAQFILKIIKMVETRLPNSKVGMRFFDDLKNFPIRSLTFLNLLDMTNVFISFNKIMVAKKFVSTGTKNGISLNGSKNQNYFGINRTFTELRDTPKSINDKSYSNVQTISHFDHTYSAKQNSISSKLNTIKSLNEKSFSKKQTGNGCLNRQNQIKKQKQIKSHLKISELYCAQVLSKNKIEKRASFLFSSNDCIKQIPKQQNVHISQFVSELQKSPISHRNTIPYNCQAQNKYENLKKVRPFSPIEGQRKFSFQRPAQKVQFKTQKNVQNMTCAIGKHQRKNSYYEYEKPINKEAFSESPNKNNKTTFLDDKQQLRSSVKNQNFLIKRQIVNRGRKYSEHAPKIKSLDQFAKKNKKMCQSSLIQANQPSKGIKYGNLKSKDIAFHTRNKTITGMAFGQAKKSNTGVNNINNDIYNGKFYQIMKSIKSKSNEGRQDKNNHDDLNEFSLKQIKGRRRATVFEMIRQCHQVIKDSEQKSNQKIIKPIIWVSNANNQTAETLNKSQLAKESQQSNGVSNCNVKESDQSNEKISYMFSNRKGLIGESNLSVLSSKTHQPRGKDINLRHKKEEGSKKMATSQDCFNKNQSESSEEFLKSNNWNKKISGLFSDVASIKFLKESNHFGDEMQLFEKQYLKDVKLQKLDKLGKQLKCSIIQTDEGYHVLNLSTRGGHNKSFQLIGEVKQEQYENDLSYLEYSTSMICQSKHQQEKVYRAVQINNTDRNLKKGESFGQQVNQNEQIQGGFNFSTQLYRIQHNQ